MTEEFEIIEIEYTDDDILYYLVDEDDVEVGFVIEEDGEEVECYYEEFDGVEFELVDEVIEATGDETIETANGDVEVIDATNYEDEEDEEHGYLYKIATIAGHEGNKARKKAEKKLDVVRGKAAVQAKKATKAASAKAKEAKSKADEMDLGITREDVSEMTSDLNALAKEGAATAKELKETYDDIMDNFGFLLPKKIKRKLPR